MTGYQHKPNQGSLWKNRQRENERHPHARGDAEIVCPHCQKQFQAWLSAWTRTTEGGIKYQHVAIQAKQPRPEPMPPGPGAPPWSEELDDDIPF